MKRIIVALMFLLFTGFANAQSADSSFKYGDLDTTLKYDYILRDDTDGCLYIYGDTMNLIYKLMDEVQYRDAVLERADELIYKISVDTLRQKAYWGELKQYYLLRLYGRGN